MWHPTRNGVLEKGDRTRYLQHSVLLITMIHLFQAVAEKVRKEVGHVEVLVNNAGILNGGSLLKLTEEDIRRTFDINILAYIWVRVSTYLHNRF